MIKEKNAKPPQRYACVHLHASSGELKKKKKEDAGDPPQPCAPATHRNTVRKTAISGL